MALALETTEMSMDLQPNEMVLYVDLPQESQSKALAWLEQLKALGYDPQPKHYTWYVDGDPGQPQTDVCALLHRSVAEDDPEVQFSALESQWDKLAEIFGSEAMGLVWGTADD